MSTDVLRVELTTEGYQYDVDMIQRVNERQTKDAFSISPPGVAASQNVLLGIQGQQSDITVDFTLHDSGEDKSNGTAPTGEFTNDTVVTIAEQRRYLREFIHAPDFEAAHTLTHVTGEEFDGDDVYLEQIDLPTLIDGNPKFPEATLGFRRGGAL